MLPGAGDLASVIARVRGDILRSGSKRDGAILIDSSRTFSRRVFALCVSDPVACDLYGDWSH